MPKKSSSILARNPGLIYSISFLLIAAVNAVVIYVANMWFPEQVVLSTMSISHGWAVALSAGMISLLTVLVMPLFREIEEMKGRDLTPAEMIAGYLVINFLAVWLVTRVSEIFGLGVSSWMVVLALAAVLDLAQGIVMMGFESVRKSQV
jgi:hypothetical protein